MNCFCNINILYYPRVLFTFMDLKYHILQKLDNVLTNIVALKSFFMNEIYDVRQEILSVWSQVKQERLHHSKNNDCVEEEEGSIN